MPNHPLDLRKRILLNFEYVDAVRFEHIGMKIVFRLKILDSHPNKTMILNAVKRFVASEVPIGVTMEVSDQWIDGPSIPVAYEALSENDMKIVEKTTPRAMDIQAALHLALSWISTVEVATVSAGVMRVEIFPRQGYSPKDEDLARCKQLTILMSNLPGVRVECVVRKLEELDSRKRSEAKPEGESQTSQLGISDSVIRREFEKGEDLFRDAAQGGFLNNIGSDSETNYPPGSLLLPSDSGITNIKAMMPFYKKIYFPFPFDDMDNKAVPSTMYGISWDEIFDLIELGKITPVITQRYGRYSPLQLRRIFELGNFVSPRELTIRVAGDLLKRNPMWMLSALDSELCKAYVHELKNIISNDNMNFRFGIDRRVSEEWFNYQLDGMDNFKRMLLTQGSLAPVHIGPGNYVARLLKIKYPKKDNTLEAWFSGLEVTTAAALGATCYPAMQTNYKLYEWIASYGTRHRDTIISQELSCFLELPTILQEVRLACPKNMPALEWAKLIDDQIRTELRDVFSSIFGTFKPNEASKIRRASKKISRQVMRYARHGSKADRFIELMELKGVFGAVVGSGISAMFGPYEVVGAIIGYIADGLSENSC